MISIIVPIFNCSEYLDECVNSILNQTYQDWELILVDDGSTDNSGEIADKYASDNSQIKVIHASNGGLSYARNIGIDNSQGDYLMFIDADDIIYPHTLSVLTENSFKYQADIIEGKFSYGKIPLKKPKRKYNSIKLYDSEKAIERVLYQKKLLPSACGKLFRSNLFKEIRFQEGLYYEDLNIFYKIFFKANKIVYNDSDIYFYRETPGSIVHSWNSRRLDVLKVTANIENYMRGNNPSLIAAARDRRLSANFNIFCLASVNNETQLAIDCWEIIKSYRKESLFNIKVRIKNKIGIILSFSGRKIFSFLSKFIYS
ncbi:MAG: glycosyltransferase [Muribaculaceae bacterium]|nr:glycosyltransferase [Muribaculaceae bacterium]